MYHPWHSLSRGEGYPYTALSTTILSGRREYLCPVQEGHPYPVWGYPILSSGYPVQIGVTLGPVQGYPSPLQAWLGVPPPPSYSPDWVPFPQERTRDQGPEIRDTLCPPTWIHRHLWTHYLPVILRMRVVKMVTLPTLRITGKLDCLACQYGHVICAGDPRAGRVVSRSHFGPQEVG